MVKARWVYEKLCCRRTRHLGRGKYAMGKSEENYNKVDRMIAAKRAWSL